MIVITWMTSVLIIPHIKRFARMENVAYEDYATLLAERDALKSQVVNLVVENSALKEYRPQPVGAKMFEAIDAFFEKEDYPESGMIDAFDILCCKRVKTPATNAAIANIQAQGVEMAIKALVTSDDDSFIDAPNILAMLSYQLRKGGQQ